MATITASSFIADSFREEASQDVKWVRVRGDMTSAEAVVEAGSRLRRACAGIRRMVLDATHIDDLDTKFIALLVDLYRRARALRIALEVLPSPALRKWLNICRLDALVN